MNKHVNSQISGLVSNLVASYSEYPFAVSSDAGGLPNRDEIVNIILKLRELLFPGYFGKQNLIKGTIEYYIGELFVTVHGMLQEQITLALAHEASKNNLEADELEEKATEISFNFLSKIPEVRDILITDVQAAYEGDPSASGKDEIIFSYPGLFAVSVQRLAHELYLLSVPMIPRIMTEYAHSITGIDIHPGAEIGKYFFIDHGTGVVVGETTVIGDYVKIYQGVTLGALSTRGGQNLHGVKRHPTLEDEVTVYSGASILGGETVIGKGVTIGSNAFITKSVPDGTRVSVKNPELQYKGKAPVELKQEFVPDWVI